MEEDVDDSEDEVADRDGEVDEQPSTSKTERRLAKGAEEEDENMMERTRGKEEEGKNEKDRGKEGEAAPKRCAFFSSFFYALLRNAKNGYSHENVRRWSRKKELEKMDVIVFPINISNAHWCVAAVYPKEKKIRYYDSLGANNTKCLELLEKYMQDEGKYRKIKEWLGPWKCSSMTPPKDCPKQTDGTSCGVFVCCTADCLTGDTCIHSFQQKDMRDIRRELLRFMSACNM